MTEVENYVNLYVEIRTPKLGKKESITYFIIQLNLPKCIQLAFKEHQILGFKNYQEQDESQLSAQFPVK